MKTYNEQLLKSMLDYIKTYQMKNGASPSYRDICKQMSLSSNSLAHRYVDILVERGELKKDISGKIAISSNIACGQTTIAPVVGIVTCGKPIYAQEDIEGVYNLPTEIFGQGELFMLRALGDSMIEAGIYEGDLLVIKKTNSAKNGDIVVALLDDSATVKRFYKEKDKVILHPENENYKDIITDNVSILGIVQHNIHRL